MRSAGARYSVAAALLFAWACAKSNDPGTGDDSYTPTRGQGGTSATGGGSGGSLATGGSGPVTTGGSSNGGSVSSGDSGGSGSGVGGATSGGTTGGGDMTGSGGTGVTGGASAMAGRPGTGGANSTGGSVGTGGSGVGTGGTGLGTGGTGSAGAPVTNAGGTGTGGTLPFDPNFKPPDMTGFAKIVVMYTASQTMKSTSNIQFTLNLKNQTDAAYPMGTVTVRYWMSAEPPPSTMLYYSSSNLSVKAAPKFVSNHANSYLEFSFAATGSLPPSTDPNAQNDGTLQGGVQAGSGVNEMFNQSNDWSFDGTAAMSKANGKITVYDGTTLIWGCEPSEVCAMPPATTGGGEAGAGGVPAL